MKVFLGSKGTSRLIVSSIILIILILIILIIYYSMIFGGFSQGVSSLGSNVINYITGVGQ